MRLRLLLRRLTVSAPRMAVRSAMPWPLRWALMAIVLGFCAAIGLWAFELGKGLAGLDGSNSQAAVQLKTEMSGLRQQLASLKEERDRAQSVANTSTTLLTAEKAAQNGLMVLNKQLENENRALRDDLGFFEKLIPSSGAQGLSIRGLHADLQQNGQQLRWQVLVIQPVKNAPEFNGQLELTFTGLQSGKPWTASLPPGSQALKFKQYARAEGLFDLPPQTVVKSVSAKVMEGAVAKASQTMKL